MNLGSLITGAFSGASISSDLVLVSPDRVTGIQTKAQTDYDIEGFIFQIYGDESVNAQADITDHYVDDNTSMQDHIAIRPTVVTVSGFIGELNNQTPKTLKPLQDVIDRLGALAVYEPELTATALRAYNTAEQLFRVAEKAKRAFQRVTGTEEFATKQMEAFSKLYTMFLSRETFTVQTPYGLFYNMAIQSMRATQADGNKNVTDFEMTFKKMRFAETSISELVVSDKIQKPAVNKGNVAV